MKKKIILSILLALSLALAGCQQHGPVYIELYDDYGHPYISVGGGGETNYVRVTLEESYGTTYVEVIGEQAFLDCKSLIAINIPKYVTEIRFAAFKNCESLPQITFPQYLRLIGTDAFNGCASLTEVTLPDSVTDIGIQAFQYCTGLKKVVLPKYKADETEKAFLETISARAFADCYKLESIQLPGGIKDISFSAFENCFKLKNVTLPDGLENIGDRAYSGCAIEKIILPAALKEVGFSAFSNCSSLSEVVINGDTQAADGDEAYQPLIIESSAFKGCPIKKLTINRPEIINFSAFNFSGDLSGLSIKVLPEVYDDYLVDADWGALASYISAII